jgi:hypothetical protein
METVNTVPRCVSICDPDSLCRAQIAQSANRPHRIESQHPAPRCTADAVRLCSLLTLPASKYHFLRD